jgi:hypothetical protein
MTTLDMDDLIVLARRTQTIAAIKDAFCLNDATAEMLLCGLEAKGVRDIPAWIIEQSRMPSRNGRDAAIAELRREGKLRGKGGTPAKVFDDLVRDRGNGWIGHPRRPAFGFGRDAIKRAANRVRS